jgi:hypothetical protein
MLLKETDLERLRRAIIDARHEDYKDYRGLVSPLQNPAFRAKIPTKTNDWDQCLADLQYLNSNRTKFDQNHPLVTWLDSFLGQFGDSINVDLRQKIKDLQTAALASHLRTARGRVPTGMPREIRTSLSDALDHCLHSGQLVLRDVQRAYLQVWRRGYEPPGQSDASISKWVSERLFDVGDVEKPAEHPVLLFAAFLIKWKGATLRPWLNEAGKELGLGPKGVDQLIASAGVSSLEDRLVIVVTPLGIGYMIETWWVDSAPEARSVALSAVSQAAPSRKVLENDEQALFDQIGAAITQVLLGPETQIELCLPMRLLCRSMSDIKTGLGEPKSSLVLEHAVVVRCWERHFDPMYVQDQSFQARWQSGWSAFQSSKGPKSVKLPLSFFNSENAFNKLASLSNCGFQISFCPINKVKGALTALDYLLKSGVSVALWALGKGGKVEQKIGPKSWRIHVFQSRKTVKGFPDVTLFWDDPGSVPKGGWAENHPLTNQGLRFG